MNNCPSCAHVLSDGSSRCDSCGAPIGDAASRNLSVLGQLAEEFTRAVRAGENPRIEEYAARHPDLASRIHELFPALVLLEGAAAAEKGDSSERTSSKAIPHAMSQPRRERFVAGTVLTGRYRIVSLLGKGGMGEVYRAEDLKLAQQVALKFLPESLSADGAALARLYREVSVARQISHPNVCRVFDIGEMGTEHFLSMEYIDGEDLASLLRRIGRLPPDKAADIARQLCAGLAAAHENNVLHRDIKPANIMIDGRGRVRITDFGLAGVADQFRDLGCAGTPAYMAPEQLAQGELSLKTDIYALGLVLYEIFTGKRAYEAESTRELARLQERRKPIPPSALIKDIDPVIERIILRCLDKNSQVRLSASQIAAALPGGDPVAAALAAGETPSPEMVAASPLHGVLRPAVGLTCLASLVVCLVLMVLLSGRGLLHWEVPLDRSPEVLANDAGNLAKNLGYGERPADRAYGFIQNENYLTYVVEHDPSPTRWDRLQSGRPPALCFWYRQSPRPLVARSLGAISPDDPPLELPGMLNVLLDTGPGPGRLVELHGIPQRSSALQQRAADWPALFTAAGLDIGSFKRVEPVQVFPPNATEHAAWDGVLPEWPQMPLHIEAAAYRGTPVYFKIFWPWEAPSVMGPYKPAEGRAGYQQGARSLRFFIFAFTIYILATLASIVLARRNLRAGRGDRRGASRLALYIFVTQMLAWALQAHHVRDAGEVDLLYAAIAWGLFYSAELWLLYIALEPYVRRRWPYSLISWSRLLAGKYRDPMVGRDILLGSLLGAATALLASYSYLAVKLLGFPPDKPPSVGLGGLRGIGGVVGQFLAMQKEVISDPMFILVVVLLLSIVLRGERLAFATTWILFTAGAGMLFGAHLALNWAIVGLVVAAYIAVLTRLGLLAAIAFQFYNFLLLNFQITSDFSAWYASGTELVLLLAVALAYYGYRSSISDQPLSAGAGKGDRQVAR